MRISQGATSTMALVSLIVSLTSLVLCAYFAWLQPKMMELRAREVEATNELAKNVLQLYEYQRAEVERYDAERRK